MDLTTAPIARQPIAPAARLAGPDVVRGVALIGVVVMNYHGYLLLADDTGVVIGDGWAAMLFDPWRGPLSTRFAATFVLVAGVGVTLLTRTAIGTPERVTAARWRLARRGVLLYVVGLLVDEVWPGTILPYYGVMFVLAAAMFTWRTRWIVFAGVATTATATAIHLWQFDRERSGHRTDWLASPSGQSIRRYVFGVFVNGTHPLLPWLSFLCAGMVLGRMMDTTAQWGQRWGKWWGKWCGHRWRRTALLGGAAMMLVAGVVSTVSHHPPTRWADVVLTVTPFAGNLGFVTSALGSALIAYAAIDWLAVRFPGATDPLRRAGQMTLSLYLLHVFVFNLVVDWWGWIEPAGLDTALAFALGFWVVAISCAVIWQRRFGRGPAERVYRAFGG